MNLDSVQETGKQVLDGVSNAVGNAMGESDSIVDQTGSQATTMVSPTLL